MKVTYEWDVESIDEHGDVYDHNHADRVADLPKLEPGERLVLVRDSSRDWDLYGVEYRQWAYVENGALPTEFDGGDKVPKRFHAELWAALGVKS